MPVDMIVNSSSAMPFQMSFLTSCPRPAIRNDRIAGTACFSAISYFFVPFLLELLDLAHARNVSID